MSVFVRRRCPGLGNVHIKRIKINYFVVHASLSGKSHSAHSTSPNQLISQTGNYKEPPPFPPPVRIQPLTHSNSKFQLVQTARPRPRTNRHERTGGCGHTAGRHPGRHPNRVQRNICQSHRVGQCHSSVAHTATTRTSHCKCTYGQQWVPDSVA